MTECQFCADVPTNDNEGIRDFLYALEKSLIVDNKFNDRLKLVINSNLANHRGKK